MGEYFQIYHEMMTGQGGQPDAAPSSRPPTMATGEAPAVPRVQPAEPIQPAMPSAPEPTFADIWHQPNTNIQGPLPTPPAPTAPQVSYDPTPTPGRKPSGWTPTTPAQPIQPPPPLTPSTTRPPFVATGGQPDHNRPPRIRPTRPTLSEGKPYTVPRVDQPPAAPPPPPEMPPTRPPAPTRPSRFPRRLS
jgi:hypothetical protein